jgi:hypothetical protein
MQGADMFLPHLQRISYPMVTILSKARCYSSSLFLSEAIIIKENQRIDEYHLHGIDNGQV